jgi:hypothetical protein
MPLLEQAVAVTRKAFGPDHPELEGSLWDLANVYRLLDRHAQALPVCQEVLDIALGRPNPSLSQASQVTMHKYIGSLMSAFWRIHRRDVGAYITVTHSTLKKVNAE